jgi:hypothetical protein
MDIPDHPCEECGGIEWKVQRSKTPKNKNRQFISCTNKECPGGKQSGEYWNGAFGGWLRDVIASVNTGGEA